MVVRQLEKAKMKLNRMRERYKLCALMWTLNSNKNAGAHYIHGPRLSAKGDRYKDKPISTYNQHQYIRRINVTSPTIIHILLYLIHFNSLNI